MKARKIMYDDALEIVCDALYSITDEGNHTILDVTSTPNSKTYLVNIYPNKTKPYSDDNTRD